MLHASVTDIIGATMVDGCSPYILTEVEESMPYTFHIRISYH